MPPRSSARARRRDPAAASAVNVRTVAARAGVSTATVSRVLNGKEVVTESTREKVLAVVKELGYAPHQAARSLAARRTDTIGVVLPDLHGEFYSELLRGLSLAARREGFHLLVSGSHSDRGEVQALLGALRGRVDALVLMFPDVDPRVFSAPLLGVPVVLLDCSVPGQPYRSLGIDNRGGAAAVVRHLTGLGHRRIAFIGGPKGNLDAEERRQGFLGAVAEAGDGVTASVLPGDFSEEAGFAAGARMATRNPRPTAVFAANDAMALGCLQALREAGLAVPEEVSLVGFDDIPAARHVQPPLTTVRVPIAELGERAIARALEGVRRQEMARDGEERLPVTLIERASCAFHHEQKPRPGDGADGSLPTRRRRA